VEDQGQLCSLAASYFENLFTSEVQNPDQTVIDKVQPRVTKVMNDILMAPYAREEVKKAMFNIGDLNGFGTLLGRISLMRS
jgi:hypothetical protein